MLTSFPVLTFFYDCSIYSTKNRIFHILSENEKKFQILNENEVANSSIFFIETSGVVNKNRLGSLNSRQVCSLESAARMNPNTTVYVIFVDVDDLVPSKFIDGLRQLENVRIVGINSKSFGDGTPFEEFTKNQKYLDSTYPREHTSDYFRFLVLWK